METAKVSELHFSDKLTDLRPVNEWIVSRYAQAMKGGAQFPPIKADKKTKEIVCGNHRVTAYKNVFGEDYTIPVEWVFCKDDLERLKIFAEDNARHGLMMGGIERRRTILALFEAGATQEEISQIFNLNIKSIEKMFGSDSDVMVQVGSGTKAINKPVKKGVFVSGQVLTESEYKHHLDFHIAVTLTRLLQEIIDRIERGYVNPESEEEKKLLKKLKSLI